MQWKDKNSKQKNFFLFLQLRHKMELQPQTFVQNTTKLSASSIIIQGYLHTVVKCQMVYSDSRSRPTPNTLNPHSAP